MGMIVNLALLAYPLIRRPDEIRIPRVDALLNDAHGSPFDKTNQFDNRIKFKI